MVLLTEQERLYADESSLISGGSYGNITAVCDWTLVSTQSASVPLSKNLLLAIKGTFNVNGTLHGAGKITVDDVPIWGTGGRTASLTSPDLYVMLGSGQHTVKFYCAIWVFTSGYVGWTNVNVGVLNFNDMISGGPWDSGVVTVPQNTLTTLYNKNIVMPVTGRTLPIGSVANYAVFIYIFVKGMMNGNPARGTHMKTPGQAYDSGFLNAVVTVTGNNSANPTTTSLNDDADGNYSTNPSYGVGSNQLLIFSTAIGWTVNINVQLYTDVANVTVEAWAMVFLCPWFTPQTDISPAALNFSQTSTFYAYLEPLLQDVTKTSKIGKKRFNSFGDATDFYSQSGGTGIIIHTYTFDVVDVPSANWIVTSAGIVCISYIGVDAR